MTAYTAPPNQTGLTLTSGSYLNVNSGGTATDTVVSSGSYIDVNSGGTATFTVDYTDAGGRFLYRNIQD
jgi:autotransporter passenger strand-loop-strand repeat protein